MTLRTRMALISAVAVAVVVVVVVVLAQTVARRELMREVDESLVDRVAAITRFPESVRLGELIGRDSGRSRRFGPESIFGRGDTGFDALFFQFVDAGGDTIPAPDQPLALPVSALDTQIAAGIHPPVLRTVSVDDERLRMITTAVPGGAVQLARSLRETDETLAGVTGKLTLAGAFGVLLAGLLGLVVARSALRPVDRLTETVEHVAQTKELAARIQIVRDDEVGRLARSFNAMLEALEQSRVQQQRLVRDAGHELRTPLTALRTNIELLARAESLPADQRRELLDAATLELRELSHLTAELVDLAADPESVTEVIQEVRLDELVEGVADRFRRRTGRHIEVSAETTTVDGRSTALQRAVGNLIDNAHKWSPDGAAIDVAVGDGRVTVADRGPGVDAGDEERVFDRFYRAPAARTTPGSGLGLAIVKKVVEEHGGTVFVADRAGGGAEVGFELPVSGS
jgi:two-component system, OmpR family, sensor histidine kinase MprB